MQFDRTISDRIIEARRALAIARADGDDYLADIHLGELESLVRMAADHGLEVEGAAETLAEYGIATPAAGVRLVDLTQGGAARPVRG